MLEKNLVQTLTDTINSLQDDLNQEKERNKIYHHNMTILVQNGLELRAKITDLENNIEFLVNNLPNNIKKLARPEI